MTGDFSLAKSLYEKMKENYSAWEDEKQMENGLFYQIDDRDGMEYSIGGSGQRPTINSYMYGDAVALSQMAERFQYPEDEIIYREKAKVLKEKTDSLLWNETACFYKTRAEEKDYQLADVRELIGYVPWYFNLPDNDKADAWKFLNNPNHFYAPFGPTTAEQTHKDFMKFFYHECLWHGPSWPYATSQTLTALGNLLCNYEQNVMKKSDYFHLLHMFAKEHYLDENGTKIPFIDENLDPFTGKCITRRRLHEMPNPPGGAERGKDYNHSSFCDLVLNALVGIRGREDDILEVNPLFEEDDLDYMCADGILYHNHLICVLWDKHGTKYHRGQGFRIYCDHQLVYESEKIDRKEIDLASLTQSEEVVKKYNLN